MYYPTSKSDDKRRRHAEKRDQQRVLIRVFDIKGDTVSTFQHQCLMVDCTRGALRVICNEPLPVGERVDIIFTPHSRIETCTVSGIPTNLAVAYEGSGFLVDIELIQDRHVVAWSRQFH